VLFPPGGSAEDLERERISLESQLQTAKARVELTRAHASAVQKGRQEGDEFLKKYFLSNRTVFSTVVAELEDAAKGTKLKEHDGSYSLTPVEGSDTLSMMSITDTFDGTYQDLMHFVSEVDKSPQMLILESLNAAPQAKSDMLSVSVRLNTFVREDTDGK
jgi:Tfp pilus assembly protein PilO